MMRVFVLATLTADGFIARSEHELANWSSKADKQLFVELTKRAGVLVMGRHTYRTIGRALPGRRNIVYSHETIRDAGVETTAEAPRQLIDRLAAEGHNELAVCGGRTIYDLFLRAGVVDELYLTVSPLLFGRGIPLASAPLDLSLKLLDYKTLDADTLLIHYEVLR